MHRSIAILGIVVNLMGITPDVHALPPDSPIAQVTDKMPVPQEDFYKQGMQKQDLKDFQGAIASFNGAIAQNPNNAEAYLYRGLARRNLSDFMGALADFKQALRLDPSYGDPGKTSVRHPKLNQVHEILSTARWQYFNEAIERNPNDAIAYLYRGIVSPSILGNNQQVIADFNKAISLQPNNAEAHLYRGIAQRQDDLSKALFDFNEAIRLNPNYAEAYFNRGLLYVKMNQLSQALTDVETSIRLNPKNPEAYSFRASIRKQQGNIKGAIADLEEEIRLKPEAAAGLYAARGDFRRELGDAQGALADYTQSIRFATDVKDFIGGGYPSYMAYGRRANLRYNLKDYRGAIADYTEVIRVVPRGSAFDGAVNSADILGDAYYRRAEASVKLGDRPKAIQDYRQAAKYYNERGWVTDNYKRAMQQIRRLQ